MLVAPAIVALRLGRHEQQLEAECEKAALAAGDAVGAAKARASLAEFRSNTASRLTCVLTLTLSLPLPSPRHFRRCLSHHNRTCQATHSPDAFWNCACAIGTLRHRPCFTLCPCSAVRTCCLMPDATGWDRRQVIGSSRNTLLRLAAAASYALVASLARGALLLLTPLLVVALRGSVRSRAFWERGLARAWHRKVRRCVCRP